MIEWNAECSSPNRTGKITKILYFSWADLLEAQESASAMQVLLRIHFNSLSPGPFDMFLKHRLNHVSCVNYYQNQFHQMREELKLENGLSVSLFELCVSQNRKITSMAVKKERLITDVITRVFLYKTFFFFK